MDKGMLGFVVVAVTIVIGAVAVRMMSLKERIAAGLIGLALAAWAIRSHPENYLQPHVIKVDVSVLSGVTYAAGLLSLVGMLALSLILMFVPYVRAVVVGFWIGIAMLVSVKVAFTLMGGGF